MRATDTEKQEEMCLAIELWRDSGLSQKVYCIQEGYTISKFKYWIKKMGYAKARSKSESKIKSKKSPPAMFYSFFGTCKKHDVNPYKWLKATLDVIADTKTSQLDNLLPQYFNAVNGNS